MLNPNVIIPFDGDNADIPAGFERDTRFDGKFPKGASSDFADTGGSNTHTHTAAHTHTIASHQHHVNLGNADGGTTREVGGDGSITNANHSHDGTPGTPNTGSETSQSTSANLTSTSNLPPYYEVIFIKSLGYNFIPVDGMVWCNGNRSGLTYHSASENKYLRGAAASGNAGGTGGATSHYHSQSHTHTANNHSHSGAYVNGGTNGDSEAGSNDSAYSTAGHSHAVTVNAGSQNFSSNTTNSSTTSSVEPEYTTLKHYIATNPTLPKPGDIAMTTEDTNPVGWIDCDGDNDTPNLTDTYIKNTATAGNTGGSPTHTHTLSHSHVGSGTHTHTYDAYAGYSSGGEGYANYFRDQAQARKSHRHTINSVEALTANYNTSAPTSDTGSNEPEYIKVKFIQLQYVVAGGALLAIL